MLQGPSTLYLIMEEEVITGTGKRPLKSLAEMLKENKEGLDKIY